MMGFEFPLLSDPDHTVGVAMGAERDPEERGYGLPRRITYLLDPTGVIRRSYLVKEIPPHADEVLADLTTLLGASTEE